MKQSICNTQFKQEKQHKCIIHVFFSLVGEGVPYVPYASSHNWVFYLKVSYFWMKSWHTHSWGFFLFYHLGSLLVFQVNPRASSYWSLLQDLSMPPPDPYSILVALEVSLRFKSTHLGLIKYLSGFMSFLICFLIRGVIT